jgi:hypothetical protein
MSTRSFEEQAKFGENRGEYGEFQTNLIVSVVSLS